MKIIYFHHAGGDQYAFRNFKQFANQLIEEQIYHDLPGHGERFTEPLLKDIHKIVEDAFKHLENEFSGDYAFFGVSMGTLISYLLCHKLRLLGKDLPKHLFLAARRCPASHANYPKSSHLPSDEFWQRIQNYGGVPNALIEHKELRDVYEPLVKSDFTALENYQHEIRPKLKIPTSILYGNKDIPLGELTSWQDHFTDSIEFIEKEGGHFFCYEQADEMIEIILERT